MNSKILSRTDLTKKSAEIRSQNQRLVLTNGCFDLLHVGHVRYLQEAKALGDYLALAVNSDDSVRNLKGEGRPLNSSEDRAEVLAALECVDFVTIFSEVRVTQVIQAVKPAVYVKGGDYTIETLNPEEVAALKNARTEIKTLPLVPGKSTSALIERMRQSAMRPLPIAILGSGKGSNCRAILEKIRSGELAAECRLVVSDVLDSGILAIAREFEIPSVYLPSRKFRTKLDPDAEEELVRQLREAGVELVVLAGFMRVLKAPMLQAFPRRIINLHPSLLPKFPGLEAWAQALAAGEKVTGCTVHYVDAGVDRGPVIAQREVPILPNDTSASLHARIQIAERELFPMVIGELAVKLACA